MTLNAVLDIDGVLACRSVKNIEQVYFFMSKGAIITAIKIHYIFPGVIEFIKFLFSIENLRISFFSSAVKNRNFIFVHELYKICLTETQYNDTKDKVKILSYDDLSTPQSDDWLEHRRLYNFRAGKKLKDITKVLDENDSIENAFIIDDQPTGIACGQAKNILFLRETENINYDNLTLKCSTYDSKGYTFFKCCLIYKKENLYIKKEKRISIFKNNEIFKISFFDHDSNYKTKTISSKKHPNLFKKINKIYIRNLTFEKNNYYIKNNKLIQMIFTFVEGHKGKTKKICRQANRIYYAAGLFFTALQISKENNISISESLFRLQYVKESDSTFTLNDNLKKVDRFYLLGLEKLREFNPNLELIHPHNYVQNLKLPSSEEDLLRAEELFKNQSDDCSIM